MRIPKDRRKVRSLAFNCSRSRVSPYPCCSSSLRARDAIAKPCPSGSGSGSGSGSAEDVKAWEDARCPICLEIPHNAVVLRCSSFEKGCRPFMCNTSYRHSNCLDRFSKSSVSSPSTSVPQQTPLENMSSGSTNDSRPKLLCPLCRGQIHGWSALEPARKFLNNKARNCSSEACGFRGTYMELRKHARSDHPNVRPMEVYPERRHDWIRFELERDHEDLLSSIQHLDWTSLSFELEMDYDYWD
ncbi:hypothetical protein V6N13_016018 [Hibiscus sabdariffa]|uniref:Uncharacterized protein n=1 Tax=Hibiscus sabdariffa TaxID=183260 RepID=A0ABR2CXD6_9ROSI